MLCLVVICCFFGATYLKAILKQSRLKSGLLRLECDAYIRHRTAPERAVGHLAACRQIMTERFIIRTLNYKGSQIKIFTCLNLYWFITAALINMNLSYSQ